MKNIFPNDNQGFTKARKERDYKNKINVYLIKVDFTEPNSILSDFDELNKEEIKIHDDSIGVLYYRDSEIIEPKWIDKFFRGSFNNSKGSDRIKFKLYGAVVKAVLLVRVEDGNAPNTFRTFALTFGFGNTMLIREVIESDFGLRAVCSLIDDNQLKQLESRKLSLRGKASIEGLSFAGELNEFSLDREQDLLKAIVGKSVKSGITYIGRDSLQFTDLMNVENIKGKLLDVYLKYQSDDYKNHFAWIDNISKIKHDLSLIKELNNILIKALNTNNFDKNKIWMSVPEIVDWSDAQGFRFKGKNINNNNIIYDDINIMRPLQNAKNRSVI